MNRLKELRKENSGGIWKKIEILLAEKKMTKYELAKKSWFESKQLD